MAHPVNLFNAHPFKKVLLAFYFCYPRDVMDSFIDDETLVAQFQAGQQDAFDELMRRYKSKIFAYLQRSVGNYEDAEDLTIDVFVKVYRALDTWQPKAKFSTWLYKIAANLAIDHHRAKARNPIRPWDDDEIPESRLVATDLASNPVKTLEEKERGAHHSRGVRAAIAAAESGCLCYAVTRASRLKRPQETLGIAEGTVKIHLHRATKRFAGDIASVVGE